MPLGTLLRRVLMVWGLAFVAWAGALARAESPRPNIVLIMADDLGYNDLACYGQTRYPTPHTDRLAQQGMRFTRAYSPSAICSPSRYSVITGVEPFRTYHHSHVLFNGEPLIVRHGQPTVASLLRQHGYRTGVVGKWHLGLGDALPRDINQPGRGPNDIGFDYSLIVADGHNMLPRYYIENGQIEGGVDPPFRSEVQLLQRVGYRLLQHKAVGPWPTRRHDREIGARLVKQAERFIESCGDAPFFLYYPTCAIHAPTTPDARFVGASGIGPHGDFVIEFDWAVGRIMATLDRLGLADNTLLIVTSDNGGFANVKDTDHKPAYPWRGGKEQRWEGGHRVPFLVRWPGHIAAGSVEDESISLVDFAATAAALAGLELPSDAAVDSFDISPALLGAGGDRPIRPYTVTGTRGIEYLAIRQGPWKLILAPESGEAELYHLVRDPGETTDVAEEHAKQARALRALLDRHIRSGSSRRGARGPGTTYAELFRQRDQRVQRLEQAYGAR